MRGLQLKFRFIVICSLTLSSLAVCSVAILWPEMWHSALEEASRLYFGDQNIPAMIATVMPLHEVCLNTLYRMPM